MIVFSHNMSIYLRLHGCVWVNVEPIKDLKYMKRYFLLLTSTFTYIVCYLTKVNLLHSVWKIPLQRNLSQQVSGRIVQAMQLFGQVVDVVLGKKWLLVLHEALNSGVLVNSGNLTIHQAVLLLSDYEQKIFWRRKSKVEVTT